jgi:hypothetical protein
MDFSLRAAGSTGYAEERQNHAVAINQSPISTAKTKEKPAGLNRLPGGFVGVVRRDGTNEPPPRWQSCHTPLQL